MTQTRQDKRIRTAVISVLFIAISTIIPAFGPFVTHAAAQTRQQLFESAAKMYNVPDSLLLAISYNQTRLETHGNQVSASGGYGLMHLTADVPNRTSLKGDGSQTPKQVTDRRLLDEAAKAANKPPDQLKNDDSSNVQAGAALLAQYAKQTNGGATPTSIDKWFDATKKFSSYDDEEAATRFADAVYQTVANGVSATTSDGQSISIAAQNAAKNALKTIPETKSKSKDKAFKPECPASVSCDYIPATYTLNSSDPTGDINNYGNYEMTNRPKNMDIKYIVIHDTEGSYEDTINHFQDSSALASSHYVVRSSDGHITQMVKDKDVAWHAGNMYINNHAIGIEHEGYAATGATWYTEEMYQSSARLVRYLANKYNIPIDRQHIIGHDQVPAINNASVPTMHWDPGPYWDWDHYMQLIGGKNNDRKAVPKVGQTVAIAPNFKTNSPRVDDCGEDGNAVCTTLPAQPTNLVYLHTGPSQTAPLVKDTVFHTDGTDSTYQDRDVSASATDGQTFVVAQQQGDWTAIWFAGQKSWFYNPGGANASIVRGDTKKVTPKSTTVAIYGRAYPEASAYPSGIDPVPVTPLSYTIPAGQSYDIVNLDPQTDYYFNSSIDHRNPLDQTTVKGSEKYIMISYNHREYFVKASDVKVTQ